MKKPTVFVGLCSLFFLVAGLTRLEGQLPQQAIAKRISPHIRAVSQSFDYGLALYLIVDGMNLPAKHAANNITRYIRLAPTAGRGGMRRGPSFYTGNTGNWTSTRIDDFVPMEVIAGRSYMVGLIECVEPGPSPKTLLSNEVEFLLLMKLVTLTPSPVPQGTTEIEVATTNQLGPQGGKVVRLGGQPATVTQWNGATRNFRILIPAALAVPGLHDLTVEEHGTAVSNKIQVRLLGSNIRQVG